MKPVILDTDAFSMILTDDPRLPNVTGLALLRATCSLSYSVEFGWHKVS